MLWQVTDLESQLEFARREFQDRAVEATEARAVELLSMERVTTAERGLKAAKVCQEEADAALQKSLAKTEAAL